MNTVLDIINSIGRPVLARALKVGLTTISNAAVEGRFPARWYRVVTALCDRAGISCPIELFSFVAPEALDEAEPAANMDAA